MKSLIAIELCAFLLLSSMGLLLCCRSSTGAPTPPIVDASIEGACAHLVSIGCTQDAGACAAGLVNEINTGANVDLPCIAGAATKMAATQCHGIGANGCP